MARTKGTWGTVREVPRKGSGRYQASYVHGGIWGVERGIRFTAPQTFDTRGDAWAWLDREHRLIDRASPRPSGSHFSRPPASTASVSTPSAAESAKASYPHHASVCD